MQKTIGVLIILILCSLTAQGTASEITIWDNQGGTAEDQEVEPGASNAPGWDLEAMYYEDGILSIAGEWDFMGSIQFILSGDIFISTSGSVLYGDDITSLDYQSDGTILNSFGYTYVFDVDWESYANNFGTTTYTYTLYQIDETTSLNAANTSNGLAAGSPVSYSSGGTYVTTGTFTYSQIYDSEFEGTTHYIISGFDLTDIPDFDGSFIAHFTQECGNDVLMGQVPEPATMLLLGVGLLGIGAVGRRLPLRAA